MPLGRRRRHALRAENCDVNLTNKREREKNCFLLFHLNIIKKLQFISLRTHRPVMSEAICPARVHFTTKASILSSTRETNYSIFGDFIFFNATVNDFVVVEKCGVCVRVGMKATEIYLFARVGWKPKYPMRSNQND